MNGWSCGSSRSGSTSMCRRVAARPSPTVVTTIPTRTAMRWRITHRKYRAIFDSSGSDREAHRLRRERLVGDQLVDQADRRHVSRHRYLVERALQEELMEGIAGQH